jgi:hypothetical protein
MRYGLPPAHLQIGDVGDFVVLDAKVSQQCQDRRVWFDPGREFGHGESVLRQAIGEDFELLAPERTLLATIVEADLEPVGRNLPDSKRSVRERRHQFGSRFQGCTPLLDGVPKLFVTDTHTVYFIIAE